MSRAPGSYWRREGGGVGPWESDGVGCGRSGKAQVWLAGVEIDWSSVSQPTGLDMLEEDRMTRAVSSRRCRVLGPAHMDDWHTPSSMSMDWVMMDGRGGVHSTVGSGPVGCWSGVVKSSQR